MALVLGLMSKWVPWPEAGVELLLAPLSPAKKQELEAKTREMERDAQGAPVGVRRDVARYQQLVGRECVRGWKPLVVEGKPPGKGVIDAGGNPLPYSPEAADLLMTISAAANFVIMEVEGLALHLEADQAEAGKG